MATESSLHQKVLVVWNDSKSSASTVKTTMNGAGPPTAMTPGLQPFQYQIPINKYSTLHSVAVKRSALKRHDPSTSGSSRMLSVSR